MPVAFEQLQVGNEYTRPQLAELWGYRGYEAISRGIVTPRGTRFIILFVTRDKQESLTQYEDRLDNGTLELEGETNHVADGRIVTASTAGDEIHLFYRDRHHTPFNYFGRIFLIAHEIREDGPSRFRFRVPSDHPDESLQTELITHGQPNEEFVPDEEGRRIIRQHVSYERSARNRRRAIEVHGNKCAACGFDFDRAYGAAHARGFIEIHHVRSIADTDGPVNPDTDLIPLCSNCHSMAHRTTGRILSLTELRALLVLE